MRRQLIFHPDTPCAALSSLDAEASRSSPTRLNLQFVLEGDLEALRLPRAIMPERSDELWRHTCFEAFVRPSSGQAYGEINLAPSRRWAAYGFNGYRQGMRDAAVLAPPLIEVSRRGGFFELRAALEFDILPPDVFWQVGLTAVIEAADGSISYWSLAHPSGKPDFHNPDGFVLTLAPNG